MADRAIRLMIVGSSPILCTGLASLLDDHGDVQLVEVGNTADQYRDLDIDVTVVVLVGLSFDAATRALCEIRARSETKLVAVVDGVEDALSWVAAARIDACLDFRTVEAHSLVDTIRAVMRGQTSFPAELLSALRRRDDAAPPGLTFTPREHDVLALLVEGLSNKSIAGRLGLQVTTIRIYVSVILAKLGVTNRTEAAVATLRQGLLARHTPTAAATNQIPTERHRKAVAPVG